MEVITFDCYGTLIDWETGICNALRPMLKSRGVAMDNESLLTIYSEIEPEVQRGVFRPYRQVLSDVVVSIAERIGVDPSAGETNSLAESIARWPAFPDSQKALAQLKKQHQLAIISNIDNDLIRYSASRLGVEFDHIITAEDARAYKPSLAVFHHAFRQIHCEPFEILHVAQSVFHDIAPATELGVQSVHVDRRFNKTTSGATPQASAIPTRTVRTLQELVAIIES